MIGFLSMLVPIYPASAQELAKDQVVVYGVPAGDIGTIDPQGGQLTQDMFHRPNLFDAWSIIQSEMQMPRTMNRHLQRNGK